MTLRDCDVAIVGAGIIGISTAHYLKAKAPTLDVVLVDGRQPMTFTSAQSGENYRNWWPHPVMKRFTDRSIALMEDIARDTANVLRMTRRGYVLASRGDRPQALLDEVLATFGRGPDEVRLHDGKVPGTYVAPIDEDWRTAPAGVDVLLGAEPIHALFPWYDPAVRTLVHVRRAGSISGQQMGQHMLERFRAAGGRRLEAVVVGLDKNGSFDLTLAGDRGTLRAGKLVNAAGPFLNRIAGFLGIRLPVHNVLQQKLAFEDVSGAVVRRMPFSIDLDAQVLDWTDEERELLASDPATARLTERMPGAIHCRPDGGDAGRWVKLGWAFNEVASEPTFEPVLDDGFPEIVLHGAARLIPALKAYYGRLPRNRSHYGGYYTMTEENWPLIGPMGVEGAFVAGAMSGFGTMAACAAGELAARWILEDELPDDAAPLSPARYEDAALVAELRAQASRGIL